MNLQHPRMKRVSVPSSTLAAVAYSCQGSLLDLEFCDGSLYRFFEVPEDCFQQFMASDSKGRYFNNNIRNRFRYQQLARDE